MSLNAEINKVTIVTAVNERSCCAGIRTKDTNETGDTHVVLSSTGNVSVVYTIFKVKLSLRFNSAYESAVGDVSLSINDVNVINTVNKLNFLCSVKLTCDSACTVVTDSAILTVLGGVVEDRNSTVSNTVGKGGSTVYLGEECAESGCHVESLGDGVLSIYGNVCESTVCPVRESSACCGRREGVVNNKLKVANCSALHFLDRGGDTAKSNGLAITVECTCEVSLGVHLGKCDVSCKVVCTCCVHCCEVSCCVNSSACGRFCCGSRNDSKNGCKHHCNDH